MFRLRFLFWLCYGSMKCEAKTSKPHQVVKWNGGKNVPFAIEVEQEEDGRWLAEVPELPGVMTYGQTRQEAIERVQVLSLRVLADRLNY